MSGRDTPRSEAPLTGRCHCGNLELALETSLRPEELSLRADTCCFCRKHGARTTSDPSGRVVITVHHRDELLRYRFGRRRPRRLIGAPTAPNRSGDGAPAPVHGSLGSRS